MAARLWCPWDENDNTKKDIEKDAENDIDRKAFFRRKSNDRIKCSSILYSKWKDSYKNKRYQQSIEASQAYR